MRRPPVRRRTNREPIDCRKDVLGLEVSLQRLGQNRGARLSTSEQLRKRIARGSRALEAFTELGSSGLWCRGPQQEQRFEQIDFVFVEGEATVAQQAPQSGGRRAELGFEIQHGQCAAFVDTREDHEIDHAGALRHFRRRPPPVPKSLVVAADRFEKAMRLVHVPSGHRVFIRRRVEHALMEPLDAAEVVPAGQHQLKVADGEHVTQTHAGQPVSLGNLVRPRQGGRSARIVADDLERVSVAGLPPHPKRGRHVLMRQHGRGLPDDELRARQIATEVAIAQQIQSRRHLRRRAQVFVEHLRHPRHATMTHLVRGSSVENADEERAVDLEFARDVIAEVQPIQQRHHRVDPQAHGLEVRPLEVVGVHHARAGKRLSKRVAGSPESGDSASEGHPRRRWRHGNQRNPSPVLQPGIACGDDFGESTDPLPEGFGSAHRQQIAGTSLDQPRRRHPVFHSHEERVGILVVRSGFEQSRRTLLGGGCFLVSENGRRAAQQKFAEQRVIPVRRFNAGALVGEQMSPAQVAQDVGRFQVSCQVLRHGDDDLRQIGGGYEKPPGRLRKPVEDVRSEIAESGFPVRACGREQRSVPSALLQHERETRRPSTRALMQQRDIGQRKIGHPRLRDRARFGCRQREVVRIDKAHVLVRHQPAVAVRRIAPRHHDEQRPGRHLLYSLRHQQMEGVLGRDFLVVVEHQRAARRQALEQRAEEPSGETGHIRPVLRRQRRHRARSSPARPSESLPEIVKERRDIGVAGIDLIPDAAQLPRIQPARHERRLARARRPDHAHRATSGFFRIQPGEQPFPRDRTIEQRAGDLGQRRGRIPGHGGSPLSGLEDIVQRGDLRMTYG